MGNVFNIFGKIIGGLPSNCTKEDMKDCLSRCNEPDHIFKSSEPWHSSLCLSASQVSACNCAECAGANCIEGSKQKG